jgi:hypothetical protein
VPTRLTTDNCNTNACITLLRQKHPALIARWKALKPADIVLCSVVPGRGRPGSPMLLTDLAIQARKFAAENKRT